MERQGGRFVIDSAHAHTGMRCTLAEFRQPPETRPCRIASAYRDAKPVPGGPASIDAAGLTCGDFIGSDPETQLIVSAWTAGYASAGKDAAKIDIKAFARHEKAVQTACAKHKKQLLLPTVSKSWQ